MAEKKKPKDRHTSGFMVRFPEKFRGVFEALTAKSRRTITVEAQIAVEAHAKKSGVDVPK